MNTEERTLIDGLFDRMRALADAPRDSEAEQLIARRAQEMPHAAYALAQTVLVQEHALQRAEARIREIEARAAASRAARAERSSSFLGAAVRRGTSVPQAGTSALPSESRPPEPAPPARGTATGFGGSFLGSALTTAAGVAGGALLYDGIRSMLGGTNSPFGGEAKAAAAQADAANTDTGSGSSSPWGDLGGSDEKDAAAPDDAAQADTTDFDDDAAHDDAAGLDDTDIADIEDDGSFDSGGFGDSDWA